MESLILAQNKRWWRALYMQVERKLTFFWVAFGLSEFELILAANG